MNMRVVLEKCESTCKSKITVIDEIGQRSPLVDTGIVCNTK